MPKIKNMFKEFKEFAIKGNAVDLAIAVVIGAAFGQVVNSLVSDILNPILGILTGHVNFGGLKFNLLGHAVNYGLFLNAIINFFVVAFAIFLIVKQLNRFKRQPVKPEPNEKICPFCKTCINKQATRCAACTSELSQHT